LEGDEASLGERTVRKNDGQEYQTVWKKQKTLRPMGGDWHHKAGERRSESRKMGSWR